MTTPDQTNERSMTEILADMGVEVTAEGKARAKAELAAAATRRDPKAREALLARLRAA